jgi:hypothetical protein
MFDAPFGRSRITLPNQSRRRDRAPYPPSAATTSLPAAILFVLLMGFGSFRKGLLWALRGDMGDYYIVDQRRNWIVNKHVDPEELGARLGVLRAWEEVR